jgi:hypothetical protein
MQIDNIAMNLMMTGIVFAGLTAVYKGRLFTISPAAPWAWPAVDPAAGAPTAHKRGTLAN